MVLAAILEWVIGFGLTFYLLTFVIDLLIMEEKVEDRENLWYNRNRDTATNTMGAQPISNYTMRAADY